MNPLPVHSLRNDEFLTGCLQRIWGIRQKRRCRIAQIDPYAQIRSARQCNGRCCRLSRAIALGARAPASDPTSTVMASLRRFPRSYSAASGTYAGGLAHVGHHQRIRQVRFDVLSGLCDYVRSRRRRRHLPGVDDVWVEYSDQHVQYSIFDRLSVVVTVKEARRCHRVRLVSLSCSADIPRRPRRL